MEGKHVLARCRAGKRAVSVQPQKRLAVATVDRSSAWGVGYACSLLLTSEELFINNPKYPLILLFQYNGMQAAFIKVLATYQGSSLSSR